MVNYSTHPNLLTERQDDFAAQTHSKSSLNMDDIIVLMEKRGSTTTKTDALAVLNDFHETVKSATISGSTVNTPLFNTSFSITGVFNGAMDSFDPKRHKLNVKISKGTLLRAIEKDIKPRKINVDAPRPHIKEVIDSITGKIDLELTSDGIVVINGYNIKIAGSNPACGLYFVEADGTEIKATVFVQNDPSRLVAKIPILSEGDCRIKIITQYSGGKDLKNPKTMIYDKVFTV
jgi:hypothetical protein